MRNVRGVLALLSFAAIVVTRLEPKLIALPFIDRTPLERAFAHIADYGVPQYASFLAGVREHTQRGDTIAIVFPNPQWDGGYSYAYYRASYVLSGREVLPLMSPRNLPQPDNFRRARLVATWRTPVPLAGLHPVWSGAGGVLLRR